MSSTGYHPCRPPTTPAATPVVLAGILALSLVAARLGRHYGLAPRIPLVRAESIQPEYHLQRADGPPRGLPNQLVAPSRLIVHPKIVQVIPGVRQQMCLFFEFPDGKVGRRSQDVLIPECDSAWRDQWAADTRALSLDQQMAIDFRCPTQWAATGGLISPKGVYLPGSRPGDYSVIAASPLGSCASPVSETRGLTHRRWRVAYASGGNIRLTVDPAGEWNTMADLLAARLRPPGRPTLVELEFSAR